MDDTYKIQVSLSAPPKGQYQKGNMLNVRGDSKEEVEFHLTALYGAEQAADILNEFVTAKAVENVQAGFPGAQVEPQAGGFTPPAQAQPVAQAPAQGAPAPAQQAQGTGAPCTLCGTPKNPVNGKFGLFFSCPNWQDQPHTAAKAQGMKF